MPMPKIQKTFKNWVFNSGSGVKSKKSPKNKINGDKCLLLLPNKDKMHILTNSAGKKRCDWIGYLERTHNVVD